MAQYLQKGSKVGITGSLRTGSYDAKDGTKRYTSDVVVSSFDFVGGKKEEGTQDNKSNFEKDMTPVDSDGDMPF